MKTHFSSIIICYTKQFYECSLRGIFVKNIDIENI